MQHHHQKLTDTGNVLVMEVHYPWKGLSETLEIGLDVSEFLEEISGKKTKFFLQIDSDGGNGKIDSFSVRDYTGGQVKEYKCSETHLTISNGMTTLWALSDEPVNISKIRFKGSHTHKQFYASPLTNGNTILFKFLPIYTKHAIFRIVNIHGQLIFEKPFMVAGTNNFIWNVISNSGKRVAKGKYIAQLEYVAKKGIKKIFNTPVYIF